MPAYGSEISTQKREGGVQVDTLSEDGFVKPLDQQSQKRSSLRKEIDTILGSYSRTRPVQTKSQDMNTWHQHLARKHER